MHLDTRTTQLFQIIILMILFLRFESLFNEESAMAASYLRNSSSITST